MILVVGVDLRLSGKDDVTVLGKAVYLVFTGEDFHRCNESDLGLYCFHQFLAMGYPASQQDRINLSVGSGRHSGNVLADVQDISLQESYRQFVTCVSHVLDIDHAADIDKANRFLL